MASISIPLVNCGCHGLPQALGADRKTPPNETNTNRGEAKKEYIMLPNKQASVIQPSTFSLAIV